MAGEAKAAALNGDGTPENRVRANAEGRVEFELTQDPDRCDTRVARACGTNVIVVRQVRERGSACIPRVPPELLFRVRSLAMRGRVGWGALFVAIALLALPAGTNAATIGFTPTGSMGVGREGPAGAELPDGKVLVVGGSNLRTSEIYDPATGTFSSAGIGLMAAPRTFAVAVTLKDGRVLVAGGAGDKTAEVFNPATRTFSQVAPSLDERSGAAGALLPDGRVLVAGGYNGSTYLQTAEIYNPTTNSWSPTSSMGINRNATAGASLADGRALIVGGTSLSAPLATAETFNPASSTFSDVGSMDTARISPSVAPLPDGRVLVAGGQDMSGQVASAQLFDPRTNSFSGAGIGSCRRPATMRPQHRCPRVRC